MGNSNSANKGTSAGNWLVISNNNKKNEFDITEIKDCLLTDLIAKYKKATKGKVNYKSFEINYDNINKQKSGVFDVGSWEYYRDNTSWIARNPQISLMEDQYYVCAQYFKNTTGVNIPNSLRLSLLNNLLKLSKDDSIKYDVRDGNNGHYYYHKTKQFGIPLIDAKFKNNDWMERGEGISVSSGNTGSNSNTPDSLKINITIKNPNDSNDILKLPKLPEYDVYFSDEHECMMYKCNINSINTKNSAIIHDLIDPNKNLNEHKLWIPTIFDCECKINENDINSGSFNPTNIIKSPILNLDYLKYKSLYTDIALVFKLQIQAMFENIVGYKLSNNEKIIVKSMKYILQKPGDSYVGNVHREGMGENIVALALYYPQVSSKKDGMTDGRLKLSIPEVCNSFLRCHHFDITEGSCIAFSNEIYHQLPLIEFSSKSKNTNPISRTILTFFLINKYNSEDIFASNNIRLNVNLNYNWIYILTNWMRNCNVTYKFVKDLVNEYLFHKNYHDYVYYRRFRMREEKGKSLFDPIAGLSNTDYLGL